MCGRCPWGHSCVLYCFYEKKSQYLTVWLAKNLNFTNTQQLFLTSLEKVFRIFHFQQTCSTFSQSISQPDFKYAIFKGTACSVSLSPLLSAGFIAGTRNERKRPIYPYWQTFVYSRISRNQEERKRNMTSTAEGWARLRQKALWD